MEFKFIICLNFEYEMGCDLRIKILFQTICPKQLAFRVDDELDSYDVDEPYFIFSSIGSKFLVLVFFFFFFALLSKLP